MRFGIAYDLLQYVNQFGQGHQGIFMVPGMELLNWMMKHWDA